MGTTVITSVYAGIATVTLNSPEDGNAVNHALRSEFTAALQELNRAREVAAIVVSAWSTTLSARRGGAQGLCHRTLAGRQSGDGLPRHRAAHPRNDAGRLRRSLRRRGALPGRVPCGGRQDDRVALFMQNCPQCPSTAEPVTQAALIAWCRENMSAYKVPRRIELRAQLPKTASGKVIRRELTGIAP